ncbi:hypothetical protein Vadar_027312 [Vaccinium darrowii]|uniref:Uncharacterized protein n=1 Tax=Vaccinium darrowii TaxID=229202 RepID=A0ACB7Y231_9ERIC|nr:hypothetical protein Vadar_027312 [Vaccinium darrowii]
MAGLFTIFVDNLPKSMDVGWLRQLFRPYGCVEDVYMPCKRSSSFNTKFGFIRFKRREEAMNAIEDLDGFMIRNFKIVVQFAKYSKNSSSMSQKVIEGDKKVKLAPNLHSWRPKAIEVESNQINSNCLSYADALKGSSFSTTKLVDAKEDNDKLLPNWFSSVEAWDNQKIKPSRCAWISCYGVPLNAWCSSMFINIGKLWGDVIRIDELTEKSIAFDKGRMFILTDFLDCINEVIHVKINGGIYPVKVIEDPMAETCWEKRVFTSIKIKKGNDIVGKEDVIEINPGDDVSVDFEVKDAQMENSDGGSRVDLLDASIHNDLDLDVDVDLEDGINDGHALKEDSLLEDAPISLLQQNGFKHTTFDESIPDAEWFEMASWRISVLNGEEGVRTIRCEPRYEKAACYWNGGGRVG